jgi:hypothetical protein
MAANQQIVSYGNRDAHGEIEHARAHRNSEDDARLKAGGGVMRVTNKGVA